MKGSEVVDEKRDSVHDRTEKGYGVGKGEAIGRGS